MYRLYRGVKERLSNLVSAKSFLTEDAHIGDSTIKVQDATYFGIEAMNNSFPTLLLMDNSSTGKKIAGGFQGTELVYLKNIYDNTIELQSPLTRDWLVSKTSEVRRAMAGIPIEKIILGEIAVANKFPYISVIPMRKGIEWRTLSGTMDKVVIDFIVYVKGEGTEESFEMVMKVADCIEWILMSNLHIQPYGMSGNYQKTSMAMVTSVNYGTIQKGSEFLKAATLTWEADLYFWRGYLTSQGISESELYGYSNENFGPLE